VVTRIDADEVIRKVALGAALLDVLSASVYEREHLPAARNVPLENFRQEDVKDLQRDDVIVVYCYDQH
jgi:rhodanese-related sulfurtransferase